MDIKSIAIAAILDAALVASAVQLLRDERTNGSNIHQRHESNPPVVVR
ncbi:hypothetical protein [Enterobacter hormaechei]|nr:hypothetical protein [Enterobacter hormaechei]MEC6096353.1 hypothetical protein [Enterobacter hormaechei]